MGRMQGKKNPTASFLSLSVKAAWRMSPKYHCSMYSGRVPADKSLTKEHFSKK